MGGKPIGRIHFARCTKCGWYEEAVPGLDAMNKSDAHDLEHHKGKHPPYSCFGWTRVDDATGMDIEVWDEETRTWGFR